MLYKLAVAASIVAAANAGTAEISSGNLRAGGAKMDNLKASWSKGFSLGGQDLTLDCEYDRNANSGGLSEATVSGEMNDISYSINQDFNTKKTTISASTESSGNALTVDYDTDAGLTEVGLVRDVDAGDRSINMDAKYLVKSKTARVKLMSAFGDDASISATVDYGTDGGDTSYEFGYSQDLKDGRTMDVEFNPDDKSLEIEFTDTGFEDGATWTATIGTTADSNSAVDDATVKVSRSWSW